MADIIENVCKIAVIFLFAYLLFPDTVCYIQGGNHRGYTLVA